MSLKTERAYWNDRYEKFGNSGNGSYADGMLRKVELLSQLPGIRTITDVGCGDFNFGRTLISKLPSAHYLGTDISETIISRNQERFKMPGIRFRMDGDTIPPGDLILCIDVLFHLLEDGDYEEFLQRIENTWTKYLAISAYEFDGLKNGIHVNIRKFDAARFGIPIVRELISEEPGADPCYFYIFEKKGIQAKDVSACLITKDSLYPKEILNEIDRHPFGEVLRLTHCDSPHRKQELFEKAKHEFIYYQDDDCIAPIAELLEQAEEDRITCAMKAHHLNVYGRSRIALIGWGSIFPKSIIKILDRYRAEFGEDELYRRETERIMTWFAYPQKRLELPIRDLPRALASDRLSMQPGHYDFIPMVEQRCAAIHNKMVGTNG